MHPPRYEPRAPRLRLRANSTYRSRSNPQILPGPQLEFARANRCEESLATGPPHKSVRERRAHEPRRLRHHRYRKGAKRSRDARLAPVISQQTAQWLEDVDVHPENAEVLWPSKRYRIRKAPAQTFLQ